jgi:peroxiredoxin
MPQIAALAERLAKEGMQLLAITRDSPAEAEPYLQEGGWDIQVLFDTKGQAARALNSWGTPQYFVLDGAGRLRFAFSSLDDLPRQIATLRAQESRSE